MAAFYAYPNNHSTINLEHLRDEHSSIEVRFYYWHDFPDFRRINKWSIPEGAIQLKLRQPWKLLREIRSVAKDFDAVYFQSFSTPRIMMPLLLLYFLSIGKFQRILIASEGLKKKPSTCKKFILAKLFNSPHITHLGIGAGSSQDFFDLGFTKWQYRKFCFNERYSDVPIAIGSNSDHLTLLSVGQLINRKGHQRFIKILGNSSLKEHIQLQIAGEGELRDSLFAQCAELHLSDQVYFHGHCDHTRLHKLFAQADAFILLSDYDGWGVVVNQAISYGLPCILSSGVRSGAGYLVDHEINGFICDTDCQVADALEKLYHNSVLRHEMSRASLDRAKVWNLNVTSSRLAAFLEEPAKMYESGPLSQGKIVRTA